MKANLDKVFKRNSYSYLIFFAPVKSACLFKEGFEEKPNMWTKKNWNVNHLSTEVNIPLKICIIHLLP